jgi:diguanylate cyclase (GGDEF)-like protein
VFLRVLDRWPRVVSYPVVGLLLALGAPVGFLILRLALARTFPSLHAILRELGAVPEAYVYLAVSTSIVFLVLGRLIGGLEDVLRASSLRDPLTGLANRRCLHARLGEELALAVRHGTSVSLLLVDVDNLKRINDAGGHAAGDVALRAVADALEKSCRRSDLAARFGGDEFAILAPLTSAEEARALAERVREVLEVARASGHTAPTVSIGICDVHLADDKTSEGLYAAADQALYEAKEQGKDRAVLARRHREKTAVISQSAGCRPLASVNRLDSGAWKSPSSGSGVSVVRQR